MGASPVYQSVMEEDEKEERSWDNKAPSSMPSFHQDRHDEATKSLYTLDVFMKIYLGILVVYLAASIAMIAWSVTGPEMQGDSPAQRRVFRTPKNMPVDELYSGIALSALLAPAGMLIQWLFNDFRRLHLFSLTTQRPVRVSDLDEIGDNSSILTLTTVFRYSWWYGFMQTMMRLLRILVVPVGTLMLTVGPHIRHLHDQGVVGIPTLSAAETTGSSILTLSDAMGGTFEDGHLKPSLATKNDTFLSRSVYTFVGSLISQSALVDVDFGVLGPVPTHNLSFIHNTTYSGVVYFEWDAGCQSATDVPYTFRENKTHNIYSFTLPGGDFRTLELGKEKDGSQHLSLWNDSPEDAINDIPTTGTSYFFSATRSITMSNSTLSEVDPGRSLKQTDNGDWISRTKCTPSFKWNVGSCDFNSTLMTNCRSHPGSNTSALDAHALDALETYMTAIPWYIFKERLVIVDKTLDTLYSIPTSQDWGHFFGNIAHSIASVSTAGYFGTATVPTVTVVAEDVYVVRTSILLAVTIMFAMVVGLSFMDIIRNHRKRLPYHMASFLAIAHAVRGQWWDDELRNVPLWHEAEGRKHTEATVMFGVDQSDRRYVRLAPVVEPLHRHAGQSV